MSSHSRNTSSEPSRAEPRTPKPSRPELKRRDSEVARSLPQPIFPIAQLSLRCISFITALLVLALSCVIYQENREEWAGPDIPVPRFDYGIATIVSALWCGIFDAYEIAVMASHIHNTKILYRAPPPILLTHEIFAVLLCGVGFCIFEYTENPFEDFEEEGFLIDLGHLGKPRVLDNYEKLKRALFALWLERTSILYFAIWDCARWCKRKPLSVTLVTFSERSESPPCNSTVRYHSTEPTSTETTSTLSNEEEDIEAQVCRTERTVR